MPLSLQQASVSPSGQVDLQNCFWTFCASWLVLLCLVTVPTFFSVFHPLCLPSLLCVSMFVYPHLSFKLACPYLSLSVCATSSFILLVLCVHCVQIRFACLVNVQFCSFRVPSEYILSLAICQSMCLSSSVSLRSCVSNVSQVLPFSPV